MKDKRGKRKVSICTNCKEKCMPQERRGITGCTMYNPKRTVLLKLIKEDDNAKHQQTAEEFADKIIEGLEKLAKRGKRKRRELKVVITFESVEARLCPLCIKEAIELYDKTLGSLDPCKNIKVEAL